MVPSIKYVIFNTFIINIGIEMPNTKISEDPSATTLTGTEILPIVQSGSNKKVTIETMLADRSVVQFNSSTGAFVVNNVVIPGSLPVAWADFIALDWTQYDGVFFRVTDRHSVGSTGGSYWWADGSGDRPLLISDPIRFTNLSDAPSAVTWPGLKIHPLNVGADMESDGTDYRTVQRAIQLKNLIAPVAHAGATLATDYLMASARIPRDINNHSLMRNGDYLLLHLSYLDKTGVADKLIRRLRWGTANTTADTQLVTTTNSAVTDLARIDDGLEIARRSSTTIQSRGQMQGFVNSGVSTSAYPAVVTVSNMDSTTDTYFSITALLDGLVGDTAINLRDFEVIYVRGY